MSTLKEKYLADTGDTESGLEDWANAQIERNGAAIAELLDALQSAINQVEYMHEAFNETGSGNGMIAQWKQLLTKYDTKKGST